MDKQFYLPLTKLGMWLRRGNSELKANKCSNENIKTQISIEMNETTASVIEAAWTSYSYYHDFITARITTAGRSLVHKYQK